MPNKDRVCSRCGTKVELPKKKGQNGEATIVRCPNCGAKAPLRFKLRNGNCAGLKEGFR